ncbi:MAG TPA: isoamylase early set domain-containing protein [Gemmatimonadaceae bacterium]|nr:isoamylase early set domain-containing protein [Gemmatimonadaceae bacterium]
MHDSGQNPLPDPLDRAVSLLRTTPVVRDDWRSTLLDRIAEPTPVTLLATPRRWSVRPFVAVAAGVVCMIAGAAGALAVVKANRSSSLGGVGAGVPMEQASLTGASKVRFALIAPSAVHVSIVGDFNQWNPSALPLRRLADGRTWEVQVPLPPGRYTYAFVVDGRISRDPIAPEAANDDFGVANSVVLVKGL